MRIGPEGVTSIATMGSDPDFLTQVVHLYYQRGFTQQRIGDLLGTSKMTISRALKKAQELGLVEVRVHLPIQNVPALESELRERLGLESAFVCELQAENCRDASSRVEETRDTLGRATALCIDPHLHDGVVVGVSLGRTVSRVVQHIRPRRLAYAKVVQLMGGMDRTAPYNPTDLIQNLSRLIGAEGYYLTGPAFVASSAVQQALLEQSEHTGLRDLWRQCDICLMGVGGLAPDSPYVRSGLLQPDALEALKRAGAVGDLLGRFYDDSGTFLSTTLSGRLNAVPLEDMKQMGSLFITAGGPDKVGPIVGLARSRLRFSLVTDRCTAEAVLRASQAKRSTRRRERR